MHSIVAFKCFLHVNVSRNDHYLQMSRNICSSSWLYDKSTVWRRLNHFSMILQHACAKYERKLKPTSGSRKTHVGTTLTRAWATVETTEASNQDLKIKFAFS
jgi:hypothetical protein